MKHPLWEDKPFSKGQAWIDLLLLANHEKTRFVLGRSLVTAEAGQIVTSEVKLAARWGWSRQKVRNFLLLLKSDKMLAQASCSSHTVLTLCNYSFYNKPPVRSEPEAYLDFR
jgi:DNA replication protein DnaD